MLLQPIFSALLFASAALTPVTEPLSLQVKAEGLKQPRGYLMAELRDEQGRVVQQRKHNLAEGTTFSFSPPASGRYAIAMFHDENGDGKLNTNMVGIPIEAYGFSNNARGRFGPPPLQDQLFEVSSTTTISIRLK